MPAHPAIARLDQILLGFEKLPEERRPQAIKELTHKIGEQRTALAERMLGDEKASLLPKPEDVDKLRELEIQYAYLTADPENPVGAARLRNAVEGRNATGGNMLSTHFRLALENAAPPSGGPAERVSVKVNFQPPA
jgi:hypothetical protein